MSAHSHFREENMQQEKALIRIIHNIFGQISMPALAALTIALALIMLSIAILLLFKSRKALSDGMRLGDMRVFLPVLIIVLSFPTMSGCQDMTKGYQDMTNNATASTSAGNTIAAADDTALTTAGDTAQSPEPKRPLIIKHGWEFPTVTFVAENIREMEKRPVDGIAIRMDDSMSERVMRTIPISYEMFAKNLRPLADLNSPTLKHNFIIVFATPAGNIFDKGWDVVAQNFGNLARAAKEVGLEGIFFDIEEYFGESLQYPANCGNDKTVEEARSKMRERGRQIMAAMRAEWSDVRFLSTHGPYLSDSATFKYLGENGMILNDVAWANVLNTSLLVGMMQSAYGTDAKFIDGGEIYEARTLEHFEAVKHWQKDGMAENSEVIPDEFRSKWSGALSSSFGIYDACSDMDIDTWKSTIINALKTADDYIWLYSEKYDWWKEENCWPDTPLPQEWDDATREAWQAVSK